MLPSSRSLASLQSCVFCTVIGLVRSMSTSPVLASSSGPKSCRIAVAQVCSTASKWSNLNNVAKCAGWATRPESAAGSDEGKDEPCQMLFLPECFGFLGSSVEQTMLSAEDESTLTKPRKNPPQITEALARTVRHSAVSKGNAESNDFESPTVILSEAEDQNLSLLDGLQSIAVESNLWISAGGMHILAPADSVNDPLADGVPQRVYNTHVIIDNVGVVRAHYAKIHLFDVCIPGQVDLRESKSTKPGTKLVVCPDSPIGTSHSLYRQYGIIHKAMLNASVSFDSRFFVWFQDVSVLQYAMIYDFLKCTPSSYRPWERTFCWYRRLSRCQLVVPTGIHCCKVH
jgi:predicted amidohydrolase